jgi:hypothetical protein
MADKDEESSGKNNEIGIITGKPMTDAMDFYVQIIMHR